MSRRFEGRMAWRQHNEKRAFYWETPSDSDTSVVVVCGDDGALTVSVSEERAVDGYNSYFDCSVTMPRAQAIKLRDLLNEWYPPQP